MAEIRLEHKRRLGWLWLIVLLIIAALVLWWLWRNGYISGSGVRTDTNVLNDAASQFALLFASAGTA